LPEFLYAKVDQGTAVGSATVLVAGKQVGEIPLLTAEAVDIQPEEQSLWQRIKERTLLGAKPRT
jgi:hypothetical protein